MWGCRRNVKGWGTFFEGKLPEEWMFVGKKF